jgi:hypothetical protein
VKYAIATLPANGREQDAKIAWITSARNGPCGRQSRVFVFQISQDSPAHCRQSGKVVGHPETFDGHLGDYPAYEAEMAAQGRLVVDIEQKDY